MALLLFSIKPQSVSWKMNIFTYNESEFEVYLLKIQILYKLEQMTSFQFGRIRCSRSI